MAAAVILNCENFIAFCPTKKHPPKGTCASSMSRAKTICTRRATLQLSGSRLLLQKRWYPSWSGIAEILSAHPLRIPSSAFCILNSAFPVLTPRYLVPFHPRELPHFFTDVLVIDGGLAGLRAANAVDPRLSVLVVTKD